MKGWAEFASGGASTFCGWGCFVRDGGGGCVGFRLGVWGEIVFRYLPSSYRLLCVETALERLLRSTNDETGFYNHAANRLGLMAGWL